MTEKYIYLDKLCGSSYDHSFTPELVYTLVKTFDRYSKQSDFEKELSMVGGLIPLTDEEVIFNQEYMAGFPPEITDLAEAYRGRTQPNNRAYIDSDPYLLTGGAVLLYVRLKKITQTEKISVLEAQQLYDEIFSNTRAAQLKNFEQMLQLN
jgi:hypothetical protein